MKIRNFIAVLIFPLMFSLSLAEAHMPGAKPPPDFKLKPIILNDGGRKIKITMEDIGRYHNERTERVRRKLLKNEGKSVQEISEIIKREFAQADGKCPCVCCAFRVMLLAVQKLWSEGVAERSDIKIISHLPGQGSMQCFEYITGSGLGIPNVQSKGEFSLIFPPKDKREKAMGDIDIDDWSFAVIHKSTGKKFEVQIKDDVFPKGFFALRKKVNVEKTATEEEIDRYGAMWEEVRDTFLTKADWEIFEGEKEPFPIGGVIFFSLLSIGVIYFVCVPKVRRNKKSFKKP